jgi:hypothetical protein
MIHKNSYRLVLLTLIGILIYSCQNEDDFENVNVTDTSQKDLSIVKLGDDLDIPYTTENMSKAFDQVLAHLDTKSSIGNSQFARKSNFASRSASARSIEIIPSHYYYRFLPKDSLEYETLVKDTILSVTNIPLHKEVIEAGDAYDDPAIEGDETGENFGWLYSVLPYNYDFPNHIENEKLEDMYFAPELDEEDEPLAKGESMVRVARNKTTDDLLTVDENGEVFEYLELEALKLTNNLDEEELETLRFFIPNDNSGISYTFEEAATKGYQMSELILDYNSVAELFNSEEGISEGNGAKTGASWWRRRKWTPHGRITVRDDVLNRDLPVRRAKVRVRKWGFLPIRKAWTNNNGEFSTRRTRTKRVKYSVVFYNTSKKFRIKAGSVFVNAKHRDRRRYKRRGWFPNFTSGRSKFYAQVHNATLDFYDRAVNRFGLQNPNWRWLRISAKYSKQAGNHLDLNPGGRFSLIPHSEIRVGRLNGRGGELRSDQLYGLVIHEMTHASHYRLERAFFINPRAFGCTLQTMAESWAEGVETIITNDRYLELNRNYVATNALNRFKTDDRRLYNSLRQNQIVGHGSKEEYTPIVIDLVDDFNQRAEIRATVPRPIDRVRGYTLRQIQTSLENARGPHGWKENLIHDHVNATEGFVEELFDVYMYDNCY